MRKALCPLLMGLFFLSACQSGQEGWSNGARGCRSSNRYFFTPSNRISTLGLRLAL